MELMGIKKRRLHMAIIGVFFSMFAFLKFTLSYAFLMYNMTGGYRKKCSTFMGTLPQASSDLQNCPLFSVLLHKKEYIVLGRIIQNILFVKSGPTLLSLAKIIA
jgi:hypothetical protein